MSSGTATIVYVLVALGLFFLDRDKKYRTSKALWIPVIWLWIVASREVSQWLAAFGFGQARGVMGSADQYIEGSPVDRAIFVGLLVIGLAVLFKRGLESIRLLRANYAILMFFAYSAASVLWSDYPDVALKRWIKAVGDLVMLTVILTDSNRFAAIKRVLTRVSFILVPLSVLIIKYYPELGRGYKAATGTPVYFGVATNKNILGVVCLISGLASLWRLVSDYRGREQGHRARRLIAHATVLAMTLWLFWMAKSLTAFACFLIASALIVATSQRTVVRNPALVHVFVALMVAISFSTLFLGVGGSALDAMGKDATLTGRTDVWELVLSVSGNPLWGTGFESFWLGWRLDKIWSVYWWHPNEAHNGYLEVYLNLGWIGLALLGLVLLTGYRNTIGGFRSDPDMGRLRLAYFVVAVIYNFTEAGFRMLDPIWIVFVLSAMSIPGGWIEGRIRDPQYQPLAPLDWQTSLSSAKPETDIQTAFGLWNKL